MWRLIGLRDRRLFVRRGRQQLLVARRQIGFRRRLQASTACSRRARRRCPAPTTTPERPFSCLFSSRPGWRPPHRIPERQLTEKPAPSLRFPACSQALAVDLLQECRTPAAPGPAGRPEAAKASIAAKIVKGRVYHNRRYIGGESGPEPRGFPGQNVTIAIRKRAQFRPSRLTRNPRVRTTPEDERRG